MTDTAGRREFAVYAAGLFGIASAAIGTFYALFTAGYPTFVTDVFSDPGTAVASDPGTLALLLAGVVLVVLLFAFVVAFGAIHGPDGRPADAGPRRPDDVDEQPERQ